jgi:hypothetical protein
VERDTGVRFVRSSNEPMRARVDHGVEIKTGGHGLKLDFFTSRIRREASTGDLTPLSPSTILQPSPTTPRDPPKGVATREYTASGESGPRRSARLSRLPQRSYRDENEGCTFPPFSQMAVRSDGTMSKQYGRLKATPRR